MQNLRLASHRHANTIQGHRNSMIAWETLYRAGDLSDITLVVGDQEEEFKAHRLVLATHSDVMRSMLYGKMKESQEDVIKLPNDDSVSFRPLLEFFYVGSVEVNKSFICQLIKLCDYYNVQELKRLSCKWLSSNLSAKDACYFLMFAADADEELYRDCLSWLDDHIAQVLSTREFVELLSADQLEKILARDCLNADEIDLFTSLVKWVEFDRETRMPLGIEIAKQIRLPMMTPRQLLGEVQTSGLVETAEIVKAVTALQQPHFTHPYGKESPAIVLRLPNLQQPRWDTKKSVHSVTFLRTNFAVVDAADDIFNFGSVNISVPSSIRVQVVSTSNTDYKDLQLGIDTNLQAYSQWDRRGLRNAVTVRDCFASSSENTDLSVAVGPIMYFSFDIKHHSVSVQVNGFALPKLIIQTAFKERVVLTIRIVNPTNRITVAIREDSKSVK